MRADIQLTGEETGLGINAAVSMATNGEVVLVDFTDGCEMSDVREFIGQLLKELLVGDELDWRTVTDYYSEVNSIADAALESYAKEVEGCE